MLPLKHLFIYFFVYLFNDLAVILFCPLVAI